MYPRTLGGFLMRSVLKANWAESLLMFRYFALVNSSLAFSSFPIQFVSFTLLQ